jgi:hypothetical protein
MNVCHSLRSPKTKVLGWARDLQANRLDADTASGSVFKLNHNLFTTQVKLFTFGHAKAGEDFR